MDELTGIENSRLTGLGDSRRDFAKPRGSEAGMLEDKLLTESLDIKNWLKEAKPTQNRKTLVRTLTRDAQPNPLAEFGSQGSQSSGLKRMMHKLTGKSSLDIFDVVCSGYSDEQNFWGSWIDQPRAGDRFVGNGLPLRGWVAGRHEKVNTIQVILNDTLMMEVPVNGARPDVAKAYLFPEADCEFGFSTTLDLSDAPHKVVIELLALLPKQEMSVPMGVIGLYKY
ncbi:MAG: hypothetical protein MUF49_26580 [Oculatellaceae cyanobacterium Prado106]|jgi:hypothetical protein|nr:hypothetical protein [Oculatellaceae cyanobacterium Prado106]